MKKKSDDFMSEIIIYYINIKNNLKMDCCFMIHCNILQSSVTI